MRVFKTWMLGSMRLMSERDTNEVSPWSQFHDLRQFPNVAWRNEIQVEHSCPTGLKMQKSEFGVTVNIHL